MIDTYRAYREDIYDDLGWGDRENLGRELNSPETDVCVIQHYDDGRGAKSLFSVSNRAETSGTLDFFESKLDPETSSFEYPQAVESLNSTSFDGHSNPEAGYLWTQRAGGFGSGDIWLSRRDKSGEWASPVNLGPAINTEFDEQMPSPLNHGRVLYFPSDRPGRHGGLDIYVSRQL